MSTEFPVDPDRPPIITSPTLLARETTIPPGPDRDGNRLQPPSRPAGRAMHRFFWLMLFMMLLVSMRYGVPQLAEEIQYSITRGQQRALHEQAAARLGELPLQQLSQAYQMVSQRVGPSVVHISVTSASEGREEELRRLFGRSSTGQGSGVIMDKDGYIVTNFHVVSGATDIQVGLSDGRRVKGRIVGADAPTDLAVLKVNADELIEAEWGESEALRVGALVWAVGSPFGLQSSVTFGILSAKNRAGVAGTPYQDFLQTDAAVNPGNSGGPLVDSQGRVVGINTAIVGEAYQGISFAIPSSVARDVYQRLRSRGTVSRGWLGVRMEEVSDEVAQQMDLPDSRGAYVKEVIDLEDASPASAAGIRVGDVIIRWNGSTVENPTTLSRLVAQTEIGSQATVQVIREGQKLSLDVSVGERPAF